MGLLDLFKKKTAQPVIAKERVTINSPIDYSALPFIMDQPLMENHNYAVVMECISLLNQYLDKAQGLVRLKSVFYIDAHELIFSGGPCTYLEKCENTKTGKVPKYIAILHFATTGTQIYEALKQYDGEIYFMQDGTIGKGRICCWEKKDHIVVNIGMKGSTLIVKNIEGLNKKSERIVLYKDQV